MRSFIHAFRIRPSQTSVAVPATMSQARMSTMRSASKAVPTVAAPKARRSVRAKAAATEEKKGFGKENYIDETPASLLRPGVDTDSSIKSKFEKIIREAQDKICASIEEIDGSKFHQDAWTRADGGGGITRVIQGGNVFEKAGVNVSVVYGSMPPEAYRSAVGNPDALKGKDEAGRVPFFAAGISSVMHPKNPFAPTMHFNYRYFETEDWNGVPGQWWFGGGTDITPSYLDEDDMKHFHGSYKAICDKHDPAYYEKFSKWCDDYFLIKHRGERRGLGGIFFDDLNDKEPETILAFSEECVNSVVAAYTPLVTKHMNDEFTEEQKQWQQLRRGRYVEFNLVYDRGTTFGLKTGGRIESILMSLPLNASWMYDMQPEPGTPEFELLDCCKNPRKWV
eukprot:gene27699-7341_t